MNIIMHTKPDSDSMYTHIQQSNIVQASFQQSVWTLDIVCSGSAREAAIGQFNHTLYIYTM